jgi:hypothetical protein
MRGLLHCVGQILLVGGAAIMLLAGTTSVLYAGADPGEPIVSSCPAGCTPCVTNTNGTCQNGCTTEAVAGDCSASGVPCGCTKKGNETVCSCQT